VKSLGSYGRARDGVIVQFVSEAGERRTVVAQGHPPPKGWESEESVESSLRRAIAVMKRWDGRWLVEVISTPQTILRDLQGSREAKRSRGQEFGLGVMTAADEITFPEASYLGNIGRLDLLAPRGSLDLHARLARG
jgi:hypothetical protein